MCTILGRGNVCIWGYMVVMCLLLQMSSAFSHGGLEKRIFCNFDGCHNKRSSSNTMPADKLLTSLLTAKDGADYATDPDQATQQLLGEDKMSQNMWNSLVDGSPSDYRLTADIIRALTTRLQQADTRRKLSIY